MLTFWSLAGVMIILALLVLTRAMRRTPHDPHETEPGAKVELYKIRLAELEAELDRGKLSPDQAQLMREEIELNLLHEIDQPDQPVRPAVTGNRYSRIAVAILIPLVAIITYLQTGKPRLADPEYVAAQQQPPQPELSIDEIVADLRERLQQRPDDTRAWLTLTRTYLVVGQTDKALATAEKLYSLSSDNPQALIHYIEALALAANGDLTGKPRQLINELLELDPDHKSGLWFAGLAAEQAGELQQALDYWQKLLPLMRDEPEPRERIQALITRVETELATDSAPAASEQTVTVKVKVALAAELHEQAAAEDTVFIYARASNGPPMPLAIVTKQVKHLPAEITLNDSMSMLPGMKLSRFPVIDIVARISKSGDAKPQTGDLQGELRQIDNTAVGDTLSITIDKVIE
ncbi:MAG: c-type cytochrome biogenesis protein CcmI [Gammaproteobacteria bacterium]